MKIKYTIIGAIVVVALLGAYIFWQTSSSRVNAYVNEMAAAMSNQDCTSLYPLHGMWGMANEKVCPRGDVGNFMVIDKVTYQVKGVLGGAFKKQVLLNVCINARGEAAWNEGTYSDCTTDPTIVGLSFNGIGWNLNQNDLDDISYLMNKAGQEPSDEYDNVGLAITYTIETHKFVQTGHAY